MLVGSHDATQGPEGCQADRIWSPEEGVSPKVRAVISGIHRSKLGHVEEMVIGPRRHSGGFWKGKVVGRVLREVDQACSRHEDMRATSRALGSAVNREVVWPGYPQGTLPEAETDMAFPLCSDGALRRWARGTLPHTSPTLNVQEKIVSLRESRAPLKYMGCPLPLPQHTSLFRYSSTAQTPNALRPFHLSAPLTRPIPSSLFKSPSPQLPDMWNRSLQTHHLAPSPHSVSTPWAHVSSLLFLEYAAVRFLTCRLPCSPSDTTVLISMPCGSLMCPALVLTWLCSDTP